MERADVQLCEIDPPPPPSIWLENILRPIRSCISSILLRWLDEFWYAPRDVNVLAVIEEFVGGVLAETLEYHTILALCLKRKLVTGSEKCFPTLSTINQKQFHDLATPSNASLYPAVALSRTPKYMKVVDVAPLELARQLTLMESKLFHHLSIHDFLGSFYLNSSDVYEKNSATTQSKTNCATTQSKMNGATTQSKTNSATTEFEAPATPKYNKCRIKQLIEHSNLITGWVVESILLQRDSKSRCTLIKHFIKVAEHCDHFNNFATRESILSALSATPIHRLKRTWEVWS